VAGTGGMVEGTGGIVGTGGDVTGAQKEASSFHSLQTTRLIHPRPWSLSGI
jgi:hypothetical protein